MHERLKFWSVSLYNYLFLRYKVAEIRKCTEWPQTELEQLTVKNTPYTLTTGTYLRGPNFVVCFALWQAVSEIQGRRKSEMHRMTPNSTWTLKESKLPCIHSRGPNFGLFRSTISNFQGTKSPKIGLSLQVLYIHLVLTHDHGPKFWSVSLYD